MYNNAMAVFVYGAVVAEYFSDCFSEGSMTVCVMSVIQCSTSRCVGRALPDSFGSSLCMRFLYLEHHHEQNIPYGKDLILRVLTQSTDRFTFLWV
jgi:hypothetical protein